MHAAIAELNGGDGNKEVSVVYRDSIWNESAEVSDSIILDETKPTGVMTINNGAQYTNVVGVTLALVGTDATSGVVDMVLSNTPTPPENWQAFDTPKEWILEPVDGVKTVYLWLRDEAGNISDVITGTITLDRVPPAGSVTIDFAGRINSEYATATTVSLSLYTTEASWAMISNNETFAAPVGTIAIAGPITSYSPWELFAAQDEGAKVVYVRFYDLADNYLTTSDSIILDRIAPTNLSIVINNYAQYTGTRGVSLAI